MLKFCFENFMRRGFVRLHTKEIKGRDIKPEKKLIIIKLKELQLQLAKINNKEISLKLYF